MQQFLITYDNTSPRDYRRLYELMAQWQAVRLAQSVWLVSLNGSAAAVRDAVRSTLETNDTVAVLQMARGAEWATWRVNQAASTWLGANITPISMAA